MGGGDFIAGPFAQYFILTVKTEAAEYATAVAWVRRLLYQTEFNAERYAPTEYIVVLWDDMRMSIKVGAVMVRIWCEGEELCLINWWN